MYKVGLPTTESENTGSIGMEASSIAAKGIDHKMLMALKG